MNLVRNIINPSLKLLGPKYRRKGVVLLPLLLAQSLLDVVSVASFAPMALLIVRPDGLTAYPFLQNLFNLFPSGNHRAFALVWAGAIGVFFLLKQLISHLITRVKARFVFNVSADLSDKMVKEFIGLPYLRYHQLQSSQELVRITQLPASFGNNILLSLATLFSEGLILLLLLISLTWYDWRSMVFLLIFVCPAIIYYRINRRKLNAINESLRMDYPGLVQQVLMVIEHFVEINLYQKREHFEEKVQRLNRKLYKAHFTQATLQANSFRVFETTAALSLVVLVVYTILSHATTETTVMLLGLYTAAGFRAVPSFNRIFVAILDIKSNEHVLSGLQSPENDRPVQSPGSIDFTNSITLRNIEFSFSHKQPIIEGLNLTIRKGEKVALMGPSGSGKTTLLLMIMRFLTETEGELLVDDRRILNDHTNAWRKHLAYVSQHPLIMDGTVIENVAFGTDPRTSDTKRIVELLTLLGLGPWLQQLPEGLQTRFGEKGIRLSGGQRQRLAIARALYSDSDILLLDEATSQVDAVTEKEIHRAFQAPAQAGKTLIMVTHRPTSLPFFDRVFQLQEGRLREVTLERYN